LFLACKVEEFPRTLRDVIENTGKVLKRKKAEELTKEVMILKTSLLDNFKKKTLILFR
jgi:hypothetical protein